MIDPVKPDYDSRPGSALRPVFTYAPGEPGRGGDGGPPVVSVVTPYFNTGEVFHETARCVLGQSLQSFEWIIVNDASKDAAALGVLEQYRAMAADSARRGPRIRVVDHRRNLGLAAARNTGYRHALGRFVFQIDADDLIEPTTLEKCAWYLESHPEASFVKGKTVGFGADEYLWNRGFHDDRENARENLATATAMVRRSCWESVGGMDETIRHGMEDWDFWMRCAEAGRWGGTINEYLDWYRRRANQHSGWESLASTRGMRRFEERLRLACPGVSAGAWPRLEAPEHAPAASIREKPPFENPLAKPFPRLLIIAPWMRLGGADRFNLDLVRSLMSRPEADRWEVTIATTVFGRHSAHEPVGAGNEWMSEFARFTPDVFILSNFVRLIDSPSVLEYLVRSRRPDVVLVSNSRLGYSLLPYLRERCPDPVYVDFNHMEEPRWKSGGHPRTGIGMQDALDLNITVSHHLKSWMVEHGADEGRIEVCHINADTERWRPNAEWRGGTRAEIGIDEDVPVILYAARMTRQKQPLVFAETIRRLRDALEPDWRERLEEYRRQHGSTFEGAWAGRHAAIAELRRREIEGEREDGVELEPVVVPPAPERPARTFVAIAAGDGELLGELRAFCERHELLESGHVVMAGAVATEAMPGYMAGSDVFFLPSEWEGIALSIYEAMSAGLAVVGADVGGQRELVTEATGVLLRGPDRASADEQCRDYAAALADLVRDRAKREALGAAARERIQAHFELRHMRERMLELFGLARAHKERSSRATMTPGLARESAVMGVELARLEDLAEELWARKCELETRERGRHDEERRHAEIAERELRRLVESRAWKAVEALKASAAYGAVARARWGPGWQLSEPNEPAQARLARLRASRSYRLIAAMKSNAVYGVYARAKGRRQGSS